MEKDITFDESTKIDMEIFNDAFALGYILELKKNLTNKTIKELLSSYLVFFSGVFCYEVVKSKKGGLSGKRNITFKDLEKFRNYLLKEVPTAKSDDINIKVKDMGLDFNSSVYDIVLLVKDKDLIDINFRNWQILKDDSFELIDGCAATPLRWVELQSGDSYSKFKEIIDLGIQEQIIKLSKNDFSRKSYCSAELFVSNDLPINEKCYILQRYGLIKSTLFINEIFEDSTICKVGINLLDINKFLIKATATVIELIWYDIKHTNISILKKFQEQIKDLIVPSFYAINRKCRDNLHYGKYEDLTQEEYELVKKYQNIYLNNLIELFDEQICFKFGFCYEIRYHLAKLLYNLRKDRED